jgi:hypothetical protein
MFIIFLGILSPRYLHVVLVSGAGRHRLRMDPGRGTKSRSTQFGDGAFCYGKWENHRKTIGKWRFTLW